jgi:hypothetical protein
MNPSPADATNASDPDPDGPRSVERFAEEVSGAGRRAYGFRQSFPAAPSSVGKARHFVREALAGIGVDATDATLAVSEMVTVALTAASGGDHIDVALRLRGGELDIEVCSPQGRAELSDVQVQVMGAVADFYERREVGDVDVQSFGCLVKTQAVRRTDDQPPV